MKRKILFVFGVTAMAFMTFASFSPKKSYEERDTELLVVLKDSDNQDVSSRYQVQNKFISNVSNVLGFNYDLVNRYTHIGNVLSIKVPQSKVELIKSMNEVVSAKENKFYTLNESALGKVSETVSIKKTDAPIVNDSKVQMNVPDGGRGGKGTFVAILDTGYQLDHTCFTNLTEVSSLKVNKEKMAELVKTKGFNGAPKTGVLQGEPGSTYYSDKIPFYYDYGGDVKDKVTPDYDVYTKFATHGQHVASLVGANNNSAVGIAPNTQLALMKVFTTYSGSVGATDEAVVAALEDCVVLGVDGLNMSLGSALDEFRSSTAFELFTNLADLGVSSNVAAGNDGKGQFSMSGPYSLFNASNVESGILGSYSVSQDAMIVASGNLGSDKTLESEISTASVSVSYRDQVTDHEGKDSSGNTTTTKYDKQLPFTSLIQEGQNSVSVDYVVVPNLGSSTDYDKVDVTGKVALIQRGELSFADKTKNAIAAGAIGVMIYNNEGGDSIGYFDFGGYQPSVPVASLEYGVGADLVTETVKTLNITKTFVSGFSSNGGTGNLEMGPSIMAPGQNIYGAVYIATTATGSVEAKNSYEYMSGTSMATPNYAGAEAYILGEKTATLTGEARKAYAKTISMRVMSTAEPVVSASGAYYSPRKQGAGYVNVKSAVNSEVYLEGTNASKVGTGKAKVELKNNEDVAKGDLKFSVKTHNEGTKKTYGAKLYVEAPFIEKLASKNLTTDFANGKYYGEKNKLLETIDLGNIEVGEGEGTFEVNKSISEASKKYLNDNFENGAFLEGYVKLSDVNSETTPKLSLPYIGFFGDFDKEEAVEPFSFEKQEGKVYGSDLLNSLCRDTQLGASKAEFGSYIGATSADSLDGVKTDDVILNTGNLEEIFPEVTSVKDGDNYRIYAGRNGFSNTLYFQQFVNRSVKTNTVNIYKGLKLVLEDHMFDSLSGSDGNYALMKSMAVSSLIGEQMLVAHRAYTIIPLNTLSDYGNGDYTIKFTYTLADGTEQTKTLLLTIDNDVPVIGAKKIEEVDGVKYLKVQITESNLKSLKVNKKDVKVGADGFISISLAGYVEGLVYTIEVTDLASAYIKTVVSPDSIELGSISLSNPSDSKTSYIEADVKQLEDGEYKGAFYTVKMFDSYGNEVKFTTSTVNTYSIFVGKEVDAKSLQVYTIDKYGNYVKLSSKLDENGYLTFTTGASQFLIGGFDAPNSGSSSQLGLILGISIPAVVLVGVGVGLLIFFLNKKKKAK